MPILIFITLTIVYVISLAVVSVLCLFMVPLPRNCGSLIIIDVSFTLIKMLIVWNQHDIVIFLVLTL